MKFMTVAFIKTLLIFISTLYYLLLSYKKSLDLSDLKKKWAQGVLHTLGIQLTIYGKYPNHKKLIFVGNHVSFLDIIVLIAVEPKIVFLSKAEIESWPIIGQAAKKIGTLFVKRESALSRARSKEAIYEKIRHSEEKVYIAGFPSGTTSLTENTPWKKGLFEVAMNTGTFVQCFKINYYPLRVCAYIGEDNLFISLMNLFKTKNKMVSLEWGACQKIDNINYQMEMIRRWAQVNTTPSPAESESGLNPLPDFFSCKTPPCES